MNSESKPIIMASKFYNTLLVEVKKKPVIVNISQSKVEEGFLLSKVFNTMVVFVICI